MASSLDRIALCLVLAGGCSVGVGEGQATGVVNSPDCDLENEPYTLDPNFFAADPVEAGDRLEIRVQRGGDFEDKSDGLALLVTGTTEIAATLLGVDQPLGAADSRVVLSLYLNKTCRVDRNSQPVNYIADSGTIRFTSIYTPDASDNETEIAAEFDDVVLTDDATPDERNATLSGYFRFLYNRGRPAQRFP